MEEELIHVWVSYRGGRVVLKVPKQLREDIKLHAENRKVSRNQVYVEALDGEGAYTEQIAECERTINKK